MQGGASGLDAEGMVCRVLSSRKDVPDMIFKTVISSKAESEMGQATIPFPIPGSEYGRTIGPLKDMDIGSPTAQDCRIDKLGSAYPILNRLVTQTVEATRRE